MSNLESPAMPIEYAAHTGLSKLEYAAIQIMAANNPTIAGNPEKHYSPF